MKRASLKKQVLAIPFILFSIALSSQTFTEVSQIFPVTSQGCAKFGDYDNDGDLDIVITGSGKSYIYRNNGSDSFENIYAGLVDLKYSYADWGDYDNDGDLDLILSGYKSPDYLCYIYSNDGNDNFSLIDPGIEGTRYGSVEWGDYNRDGKSDILICGQSASGKITRIYQNKGNDQFDPIDANLPGIQDGNATWGDYDNDGDLDILLTGEDGSSTNRLSALYINYGSNTFKKLNTSIKNASRSEASWGDYDNDGDLDIVLGGYTTDGYEISIYRNEAAILFTSTENELSNLCYITADWGDYDNDSDLDILITGYINSSTFKSILVVNYGGVFIETDPGFYDSYGGSSVWGDYDNDGDLDALITGSNNTKLYRNDGSTANNLPSVPSGLSYQIDDDTLVLQWNESSDIETDEDGLTYNIRLGTGTGEVDEISPQSNVTNGNHMIPLIGNTGTNEYYKIHLDNIAIGNHYWSVQTIDNIYAGSAFASESIISDIPPTSSFKFAYDSICFIDTAIIYYTGNASPSAIYTWNFDGAEYVSGSGQGPYEVKWANYGDYSVSLQVSESGLNSSLTSKNINVSSQCFIETEISVEGSKYSSLSWADYDNDNDLDFFISGEIAYHTYISKIYRNDGENDFVDINAPLEEVGNGDNGWCDYDNDGDLDLLVTGKKYTTTWTGVARIYRNDGNDNFVDINADMGLFANSSADWGDYDNDGDYDILLIGYNYDGTGYNSVIYRNDGNDTFTKIICNIEQVGSGDAKWGDYDNDGDLDFIITGNNPSSTKISKIYRNDGNDIFTDIEAGLVNVNSSSIDWGDYDSDGDLDLLLSGYIQPRYTTKIYRNDGNDVFTDIEANLADVSNSSVLWGDLNNDGSLDVILSGKTEDEIHIRRVYINEGNDNFSESNRELSILDQGITIMEYTITDHDIVIGDYDFDNDLDILLTYNDYDEQLFCKIFKNETQLANSAPSVPLNLNSTIQNDTIILSWSASNDDQTPEAGLTYNVRLGSATGLSDVLSPMSDITTGHHLIPGKGNAGTNKFIKFIVNGLNPGINYWSVQAIDNNFEGSEFPQEQQVSNIPPTSNFEMNENICYCDTATIYYSGNASETAEYNWTFENADYIAGTGQGPYLVKWDNPDEYRVSLVVTQNSVSSAITEKTILIESRCFKETNIAVQGTYEGQSAWGDYDNDGDMDILVSSYYYDNGQLYATRIYRNDGNDVFTDIDTDLPDASSSIIDWGDYDNDNDLDILIIQNHDGEPSVFRNNGDDTFTDINAGLYYTKEGSAKWGDYDNDGDLDIIIIGSFRSEIYVNEGNDIFSILDVDLVKISSGSVNWCDFDKDNDLDILIAGIGAERYGLIYRNDGNGNFVNVPVDLTGVDYASTDVGDYDSDGDQDIIISGRDGNLDYITKIYRNEGNLLFTDIGANLIGGKYSYVKWGDMDNDGDLDFIFVGDTLSSNGASIIYENKGNDSFVRCNDELFGIQYYGIASWGDYDNDNDLDLMLSGLHKTKIYKNFVKEINERPSAPSNLNYDIKEDTLILKWSPSSDIETSQSGLSYNVRIGSSSGGYDNVTPMSDITTGFHFIPGFGNAGTDTSFMVSFEALSPGTNYWSVQTIDNSFIASEFSVEQLIPDIPPTSSFHFNNVCFIDSTTITYTGTAGPSATYDWTFEDADVIIGSGQGPYTVCWNTPGTYNISLQVTEDTYTSNITTRPIEIYSQCFRSDTLTIPGMKDGTIEWGDYDDDGDLDVLLVGRTETSTRFSRIYQNNGGLTFNEVNPGLTDIYLGGAKWGDYDNDNDLDILLSGSSADGYTTQIYRNDGLDIFYKINIEVTGFAYCSVYWTDYDNDGDLDFMVGGMTYEGRKLKIYRNIGNDEFTDIEAEVYNDLYYPEVKWADFDNDKDLDLFINEVYYINNGDHTFSPTNITVDLSWLEKLDYDNDGTSESFPPSLNNQILYQSEAIGDSDNDGDLDVLITGQYLTVLFKNICYHPNSTPNPPVNLSYDLLGDSVILKWGRSFDTETGKDSLTYNIRIGSTPGGTDNLSPMANTSTNYHLISQFGNAGYDTSYYININGLSIGTNYWSVQAIDQGLASSEFASESTLLNIPPSPLFTFEDSLCYCDTILISYSGNGSPSATYNWDFDAAIYTSGSGQGPWLVYWGEPGYHKIWLEVTENTFTSERTDSIYLNNQCFRATSASFLGADDAASEWADYDSDGDLDVLITDYSGTYLYCNDGNDLFTMLDPGFIGVMYGCIDWGDYDNDNDLDLLIAGNSSSGSVRTVYRNDGSNIFTDINAGLVEGVTGTQQFGNTAYWGDYDNDGDLDILISGTNSSGNPTGKIYRNDNDDVFTDIYADIPQVFDGEMQWFDFDNDNRLDILAAGTDHNGNRLAEIYKNDGDGEFTDINAGFEGVTTAKVSITDFNNDGNPDILISGDAFSGKGVNLYQNNGNLSFTRIDPDLDLFYGYAVDGYDVKWINYNNSNLQGLIAIGFTTKYYNYTDRNNPALFKNESDNIFKRIKAPFRHVIEASGSFADYDNDGDLDVLISGRLGIDSTVLYKNYVYTPNELPSAPDNLDKIVYSNNVILNWEKSSDNETPTDGLTYNVVVGSTPGNFDIVSPSSDIGTGHRSIVKHGNSGYRNTFQLNNLPVGTYYWQVQSIDNNLSGSEFSSMNAFTINEPFTEMDLGIAPGSVGDIAWGDYDNDGDLDFAGTYMDYDYFFPMVKIMRNDGNEQFFDINEYLSADLVVYYDIMFYWYDINNDGRLDLIDLLNDRILRNDGNDVFTTIEYNFEKITSYALGDYDNDTDADILVSQQGTDTCIVIYRNNGNFNFTPVDPGFANLYNGSVSFTDYDNDLDLDVLITGEISNNNLLTQLYRNDGNDNFSTINTEFTGVKNSAVKWCDYDNDSDLDVVITGQSTNDIKFSGIYRNNSNNTFTLIDSDIRSVINGSVDWGDYDVDGDNDLIITGESGSDIALLYRNDGNDIFTELDFSFYGNNVLNALWGNYDNDGDLDILLLGFSNTYLYRNNGNWINNPPDTPGNLDSELTGFGVTLKWNDATDDKTPQAGLDYNIRLGTVSGSCDILDPMSDLETGYRKITTPGNALLNNGFRIDSLQEGTYYWSVQAIDNTKKGGAWAPEESFDISVIRPFFDYETVCFGNGVQFTDQTLVTGESITSWLWEFGDGQTSDEQNPVHLYDAPGYYTVQLTAFTDQSSSSVSKTIYVKPGPIAEFAASTECLLANPTSFTNNSITDTLVIDEWYWDFGDGIKSYEQNPPDKLFLSPGNFDVKLRITASNGCLDSITHDVVIGEYPTAAITSNLPLSFCEGDSTVLSVKYNQNYNYQWMLDGAQLTDADSSKFTARHTGNYSVKVINNTGNCSTLSYGVDVISEPAPVSQYINTEGNTTFCQGDSIILSVTNDLSLNYQWKLNGGAVGSDSSRYSAKSSGTYSLTVTNSTGCSVDAINTVIVTVNPAPTLPTVNISGPASFCGGDSVILNTPSVTGNSYYWRNEYGLIAGATSNSYTAKSSGTYQLDISNTNGCSVTTSAVPVTVKVPPTMPVIESANYTEGVCPGEDQIRLSATQTVSGYHYLWYKDGLPLANDTLSYLYLSEKGNYILEAELNGCIKESEVFNINLPEAPEKPMLHAQGPTVWYLTCSNKNADFYKWYCNSNLIEGANDYYYVAGRKMGDYQVSIGNELECFTRSDFVTIPTGNTGLDDVDPFEGLKIYPNPTNGLFTIEIDNNIFGEMIIRIISENGKEIMSLNLDKTTEHFLYEVNLSGQPQGLYIINLLIDRYFTTRKIIVE